MGSACISARGLQLWDEPACRAAQGCRFCALCPCSTTVIPTHAERLVGADRIDGTRAVLFDYPDHIHPDRRRLTILRVLAYFL